DLAPQTVRLVHDRLRLFVREVHPGVQGAVLHEVAAVRVVLDPVRAVFDLLAHGVAEAVHAVGDLDTLRNVELPREPQQGIGARGGEGARGYEHPRTGDHAAVDRVAHVHVR